MTRTFIELLIDEPRLEVSCEGNLENPHIRWRCSACGVGVTVLSDRLLEIQFAHRRECLGFGGERRGGTVQAAEVLAGLAFICSGDFTPLGQDSLSWAPEAAARLHRHPGLFERPHFNGGVPPELLMLQEALVEVVDGLTVMKR